MLQIVEENGPLPDEQAIRCCEHVADALSTLHSSLASPVIHRDVSPGNIVVSANGATLIDLGIARTRKEEANRDTRLWGTQGYTAPEQFGFRQTDARTDVYALGMCLRFMLTGRQAQEAARVQDSALARVIEKGTAMDPDARFACGFMPMFRIYIDTVSS